MKYKFITKLSSLLLTVIILFQSQGIAYAGTDINTTPNNPNRPEVNAVSAILTDPVRGQILYGENIDDRLHISVANKIMTALVVILNIKPNDMITISKESVDSEGSTLLLEPGEKYKSEDLVYAIMLRSYNDAARALAEFTGGSINDFVSMMNELAQELNMKDTHFSNPTGLYAEDQYTTARDLATLIKYAISIPDFNRIFSSRTKIWTGGQSFEVMTSQCTLFWEYDELDGGKTGYNEADKRSIVTTATKDEQRLISIILDAPEETLNEDTEALLEYGFKNFMSDRLVYKREPLETIQVEAQDVNLISINDIYYIHPRGNDYIKNASYTILETIELPILPSKVLGTAKFELDDGTIIEVNMYPDREIRAPESKKDYIKRTLLEHKTILYVVAVLLILEAVLLLQKIIRGVIKYFKALPSKK